MKNQEVNPLSVFGLRQMQHCPPHFVKVKFELRTDIKHISDWIWENLSGRFWLGQFCYTAELALDSGYSDELDLATNQKRNLADTDSVLICYCAAFELGSEASYFSLILDSINQWDSSIF